ncbi:hypothetical protein BH09SUM1_BH09SUM1_17820 [soil metagenome]
MDLHQLADALVANGEQVAAAAHGDISKLKNSYGEGKWNGIEIISHIADVDVVNLSRFMRIVAEPGCDLPAIHADNWNTELKGASRPTELSIATIRSCRATFAFFLRTIPEETLKTRTGNHSEKGPLSALDLVAITMKHTSHHLEQVDAIRQGKSWVKG